MRRALAVATFALLAAAPAAAAVAAAQAAARTAAAVLPPDLDAFVAEAMRAFEVPGLALAVVKDGEVVLAKGYGVPKLGTPAPVDASDAVRHRQRLRQRAVPRGVRGDRSRQRAAWEDFVGERVLARVGLRGSNVYHSEAVAAGNVATPHARVACCGPCARHRSRSAWGGLGGRQGVVCSSLRVASSETKDLSLLAQLSR